MEHWGSWFLWMINIVEEIDWFWWKDLDEQQRRELVNEQTSKSCLWEENRTTFLSTNYFHRKTKIGRTWSIFWYRRATLMNVSSFCSRTIWNIDWLSLLIKFDWFIHLLPSCPSRTRQQTNESKETNEKSKFQHRSFFKATSRLFVVFSDSFSFDESRENSFFIRTDLLTIQRKKSIEIFIRH